MGIQVVPEWMAGLEEEDVAFLKKFPAVLWVPERDRRAIWGDLSHGPPSAGPDHSKGAARGGVRRGTPM